ncbi:type II toxin-antitoxin system YafQ family toxin [Erythrobacter sp. SAORIC-644]|uniref:type II toxin-antitoxin system YafQ family toxin n=1 Tax=Erythrobacter sp. SAORIC-644 TaxID=1869314 RepID=UPI000C9F7DEB|nr:type II toxin-antitoxin system YafQ family toxin [Erythrobacter sp. SAORIC-644]PNQ77235.1 type II toxin-antitoxin system YafQ family toxin [Erythrobacter sp. SAORIC-644]
MKKAAASKRTALPRTIGYAKSFLKDFVRLSRSGRYDMKKLKQVMLLLIANDAPLGPEWKDHALKGEWQGHRECHVGGDFLLIYRVEDIPAPGGGIFFTRAGTHSELFK